MRQLNLQFAASDFIVDKAGTTWFLESNPNGAWGWLESFVPDLAITDSIAEWILGRL
jgi:D-alanine-D-alanine ligase-like ATP-grasp enzyme